MRFKTYRNGRGKRCTAPWGRRDGLLTEAELKPIFHQLHPTEHDYARIQVGAKGRSAALCVGHLRAAETCA